jgi:hypothetical protein
MIKGEDLKAELSSGVERLCDAGKVGIGDFAAASLIDADDLCTRWNMSRRTLVRMRKRGLVGRRLLAEDGKPRVMFDAAVVAVFEKGHTEQISRAADYSRISPEDEARIIRRAARYKRWLGWSLNMAAERIAERYARSHEAIRQVLKRYETRAKEANERSRAGMSLSGQALPPVIFDEAQPLTQRRREAVYRAWRLGIDPNQMSVKYRRSRPALPSLTQGFSNAPTSAPCLRRRVDLSGKERLQGYRRTACGGDLSQLRNRLSGMEGRSAAYG